MGLKKIIAKWLPHSLKERFFLKSLKPFSLEEFNQQFVIKVAETPDEILSAYKLIYENYFLAGLCELDDEMLRLTKHALLPTTSVIIVKHHDQVIATMSVILDNPLKLPMESLWPLDFLRKSGNRIAEISTLSIKPNYRNQKGRLLLPLTGYLYRYALNTLGVDFLTLAVHPYSTPFYSAFFNARFVDKKVMYYKGANHAPAAAMTIDLKNNQVQNHVESVFFGPKLDIPLIHYMHWDRYPRAYVFPERKYFRAFDPGFHLDLLKDLFKKNITGLKTLTEWDKEILTKIYPSDLQETLEVTSVSSGPRETYRYPVNCSGIFTESSSGQMQFVRVFDISDKGLLLFNNSMGQLDSQHGHLALKVSKDITIQLEIQIVRTMNQLYGAKIVRVKPVHEWKRFLEYLHLTFFKTASADQPLPQRGRNLKSA
ncbi:MAG: hypothetical protein H6626_13910 [Pseudobdellovibrionaceae bacterium]|nr:hypothetical protein [Bdellovibrionales bacterium]USN47265.1 MAG: hypothetical protein H6626_13910 [Pseudobdellovibrionaceae bacterium]